MLQPNDVAVGTPGLTQATAPTDSGVSSPVENTDEDLKYLEDYATAKVYLNTLIGAWSLIDQKAISDRLTRDVRVDVDQLREMGDIDDDECFIPERVIDSNIQREMPSYMNFLKNSRRISTFTDVLDETFDTDRLEQAFTKGMTYKGWTKPHFKVIDSGMAHGWAWAEVVFDQRFPLNVGIEFVAFEDLIFPLDSKDHQTSSSVLRRYKLTPLQLKDWVKKFGFDSAQVDMIIENNKSAQKKDDTVTVFKRLCKYQNCVYVSWFSLTGKCTNWLKAPQKLYTGIDKLTRTMVEQQIVSPVYNPMSGEQIGQQPTTKQVPQDNWEAVELENYPIFRFDYRESEKPLIVDRIGRVTLDKDKQEAMTAVITAFINRLNRSAKVYASPGQDSVDNGQVPKQLANVKWSDGTIWNKPMLFWSMEAPDPLMLKSMEYMKTSNSQDIGQTDYAARNREDSRKTATEITSAEKAQLLLDSVDLTLYSEFIREVYAFAWLIVRSQALQNKIKFLLVKPEEASGQDTMIQQMPQQPQLGMGQPPPPNGSIIDVLGSYQQEATQYINDYDTIVRQYDVRAAGDVDVIQKQELTNQMQMDWPVIQTTPLAGRFLADLMKLKYPQDGAIYSKILMAGNPKNAIIQSMGTLIMGMLQMPDVAQHIDEDMKQQLVQIQQEAQQALQTP